VTKLLFCQTCGDMVVPDSLPRTLRWCLCLRHAVWWEDPRHTSIRVYDRGGVTNDGHAVQPPKAWIIGLSEDFLYRGFATDRPLSARILPLFSAEARRVLSRHRPDGARDSAYAHLPNA
jgi:hypothetical protein